MRASSWVLVIGYAEVEQRQGQAQESQGQRGMSPAAACISQGAPQAHSEQSDQNGETDAPDRQIGASPQKVKAEICPAPRQNEPPKILRLRQRWRPLRQPFRLRGQRCAIMLPADRYRAELNPYAIKQQRDPQARQFATAPPQDSLDHRRGAQHQHRQNWRQEARAESSDRRTSACPPRAHAPAYKPPPATQRSLAIARVPAESAAGSHRLPTARPAKCPRCPRPD